jgi:hypothetical protein
MSQEPCAIFAWAQVLLWSPVLVLNACLLTNSQERIVPNFCWLESNHSSYLHCVTRKTVSVTMTPALLFKCSILILNSPFGFLCGKSNVKQCSAVLCISMLSGHKALYVRTRQRLLTDSYIICMRGKARDTFSRWWGGWAQIKTGSHLPEIKSQTSSSQPVTQFTELCFTSMLLVHAYA